MRINGRTLLVFIVITAVIAILRYFMKGWVQPLGISDKAGSFIASITLFMLLGMVVFFFREGRAPEGNYWRGVGFFAILSFWCQILIVAGILITARTGTATYYEEAGGQHLAMPPATHALMHLIGSVAGIVIGSLLGGLIYWVAKRGRRSI